MVTEIAYIVIDPANAEPFETAVARAAEFFKSAKGCRSFALSRVIETKGAYRLQVGWDTVDDHMVTFRESEGFQEWRKLAGPFFIEPPRVEHWEETARHF